MWLVDLVTTGGFGAVVGLVGSYLTKREERMIQTEMAAARLEEAKLEFSHELSMADKQMERAEVEGNLQVQEVEAGAFVESVKTASATIGITFVDAIRGLMRPVITLYLLGVATLLAIKVDDLVGGMAVFNGDQLFALYDQVIMQVIFLTATAVTWWFGSRPAGKPSSRPGK